MAVLEIATMMQLNAARGMCVDVIVVDSRACLPLDLQGFLMDRSVIIVVNLVEEKTSTQWTPPLSRMTLRRSSPDNGRLLDAITAAGAQCLVGGSVDTFETFCHTHGISISSYDDERKESGTAPDRRPMLIYPFFDRETPRKT